MSTKGQKLHRCSRGVYRPCGLLLQWHVTNRCNLCCTHCYQDEHAATELVLDDLLGVLAQYKSLLAAWRNQQPKRHIAGHITVTGGEPFMRHDFVDLLEVLGMNQKCFSFAILTNGTMVTESLARRLRRLKPAFVQVSIEGSPTTHDRIRGRGSFEGTVAALKFLIRQRIPTMISFTAHRNNFQEFPSVARLGRKLGATRVWADRLIPEGRGSAMNDLILTAEETRAFFEIMRREQKLARRCWFERTEIAMHRSLQFLVGGGRPYHCTAGDSLLTVMPNGDLYPCRRMPVRLGNLLDTPLASLYYESDFLGALRNRRLVCKGCQSCDHSRSCRGGSKCLAYAMTGDPFQSDPGCWLSRSAQGSHC